MMKKASQREEDNIYVFPNTCVGRTKQWYFLDINNHDHHDHYHHDNYHHDHQQFPFAGGGTCLNIQA